MLLQGLDKNGVPSTPLVDPMRGLQGSASWSRYMNLALAGRLFHASLQAATALSTLNATATGLIITNPHNSGKLIALETLAIALATAPAGIANIHLAYGAKHPTAVTQTTPLTVRSGLLERFTGGGVAASAATLPAAPVAIRPIGGGPVATGSVTAPFILDDVAGGVIIEPGSSLSLGYLTTAISVLAAAFWSEHPLSAGPNG